MLKKQIGFDVNAKKYSQWNVTTNSTYLTQFYNFAGISSTDKVIDIACGSGDFLLNCADDIGESKGIDLSESLIKIANAHLKEREIKNVYFEVKDIEKHEVAYDTLYDAVICRMALHHFNSYDVAFQNCLLFGKSNCKVAMQDIIAHNIEEVDQYFDKLERLIDNSHNKIISRSYFEELFKKGNIDIINSFVLEREIVLKDYMMHANQTVESNFVLEKIIGEGLEDPIIGKYIYLKDNQIVFKRKVLLINGRRR